MGSLVVGTWSLISNSASIYQGVRNITSRISEILSFANSVHDRRSIIPPVNETDKKRHNAIFRHNSGAALQSEILLHLNLHTRRKLLSLQRRIDSVVPCLTLLMCERTENVNSVFEGVLSHVDSVLSEIHEYLDIYVDALCVVLLHQEDEKRGKRNNDLQFEKDKILSEIEDFLDWANSELSFCIGSVNMSLCGPNSKDNLSPKNANETLKCQYVSPSALLRAHSSFNLIKTKQIISFAGDLQYEMDNKIFQRYSVQIDIYLRNNVYFMKISENDKILSDEAISIDPFNYLLINSCELPSIHLGTSDCLYYSQKIKISDSFVLSHGESYEEDGGLIEEEPDLQVDSIEYTNLSNISNMDKLDACSVNNVENKTSNKTSYSTINESTMSRDLNNESYESYNDLNNKSNNDISESNNDSQDESHFTTDYSTVVENSNIASPENTSENAHTILITENEASAICERVLMGKYDRDVDLRNSMTFEEKDGNMTNSVTLEERDADMTNSMTFEEKDGNMTNSVTLEERDADMTNSITDGQLAMTNSVSDGTTTNVENDNNDATNSDTSDEMSSDSETNEILTEGTPRKLSLNDDGFVIVESADTSPIVSTDHQEFSVNVDEKTIKNVYILLPKTKESATCQSPVDLLYLMRICSIYNLSAMRLDPKNSIFEKQNNTDPNLRKLSVVLSQYFQGEIDSICNLPDENP